MLIILLFVSILAYCEEGFIGVDIKIIGDKHIKGEPIMAVARVYNKARKDFYMDGYYGEGYWFKDDRICLKEIPIGYPPIEANKGGEYKWEVKEGWFKEYVIDLKELCDINDAGVYGIDYRILRNPKKGEELISRSEKLEIIVEEPIGEDLQAYNFFNTCIKEKKNIKEDIYIYCNRMLLAKFPTSTYAGWVLERYFYRPVEYDIEKFYFSLKCNPSNSVPTKDGWQSISGKDYLDWQKEWAERILENHPDFAMKESLKLLLAVINFWEGDEGKAEEWLGKLSKESKEYKWGRKFIEYVKRESKKIKKMN